MEWALIAGVALKVTLAILGIVGVPLVSKAKTWVDTHIKSTAAKSTLTVVGSVAAAVVTDIAHTVVPEFQAKLDAGTLTKADIAALTETAIARLRAMYGQEGLDKIVQALQLEGGSTEKFLASQISLALYNMKAGAPLPVTNDAGQPTTSTSSSPPITTAATPAKAGA